jgi:hypothetical protein
LFTCFLFLSPSPILFLGTACDITAKAGGGQRPLASRPPQVAQGQEGRCASAGPCSTTCRKADREEPTQGKA